MYRMQTILQNLHSKESSPLESPKTSGSSKFSKFEAFEMLEIIDLQKESADKTLSKRRNSKLANSKSVVLPCVNIADDF